MYILISDNKLIHYFHLTSFHVSNNALLLPSTPVLSSSVDFQKRVLDFAAIISKY